MSPLRTSEPRRPLGHRAALSRASAARALLVRNAAHPILISGCCWRDQREDLGVGPLVRVRSQEDPLAWSIACGGLRGDGRGVVSTGPWSARHGGGHGAAARRHREQQQVSTWCTGRCWRAAGGARRGGEAAGGRRRLQVCRRRRRSACAECEMRRRASGGPAAEDHGARPKYKGRLARAVRIVYFACVPPRRPSAK